MSWELFQQEFLPCIDSPIQVEKFHILVPGIMPLPVAQNPLPVEKQGTVVQWDQIEMAPSKYVYSPYGVFEVTSSTGSVSITDPEDPVSIIQREFMVLGDKMVSSLYQALLVGKALHAKNPGQAEIYYNIHNVLDLSAQANAIPPSVSWGIERHKFMSKIVWKKYQQSIKFQNRMQDFGDRKILYEVPDVEQYWSCDTQGPIKRGQNAYGHILDTLRRKLSNN